MTRTSSRMRPRVSSHDLHYNLPVSVPQQQSVLSQRKRHKQKRPSLDQNQNHLRKHHVNFGLQLASILRPPSLNV
jgi:hypothetical protein